MASPPKTFKTTDGREITCREDLPNAARLLARLRPMSKWYWAGRAWHGWMKLGRWGA